MTGARSTWRLMWRSIGYEFRKRIQFRTGFFVREVLNGVVEPLVMLFVYTALYSSAAAGASLSPGGDGSAAADGGDGPSLGGWRYGEIVQYVAGLMVVRKLVFDNRGLELSSEIFEGRITKYLVMPFRFFVLLQARFAQYTLMQVVVAGLVWVVGFWILGDRWLVPVSLSAAAQAFTLVLLGSYCCFLFYVILSSLAFWLDVVWSLLVMAWFVISFTGGAIIPVSQMPAALFEVFSLGFPYWTITAPIEILMGRLGSEVFPRGLLLLGLQLGALELLRRFVWARGLRHYVGAGM